MNKGFSIIELLAILLIMVVLAVIGVGIYQDVSYGKKQGIVVDKKYTSAWVGNKSSYVNVNSINIPVVHPESWSIKIKKDDKEIWIDVDSEEYKKINIGDCYQCENGTN